MKDIGEKLRTSREEAGLSLEEVAEDLKLELKKLQAIEEGNKEVFKDIYDLKYCIRDYAKYLCLDYEKLVNDFNEFVFEYTSKIPVVAIEQASKENNEKTEKKIISPYTMENNNKTILNLKSMIIITIILLIISILVVFFISNNNNNNENTNITLLM